MSFYSSDSAITGLRIGAEEYRRPVSDALFEAGINAPAMTYPVVARGEARLRIQVSAAHTDGDLDQVAQTISRCIGQTSSQAPAVDCCRSIRAHASTDARAFWAGACASSAETVLFKQVGLGPARVRSGSGSNVRRLFGTSGQARIAALPLRSLTCQFQTFAGVNIPGFWRYPAGL